MRITNAIQLANLKHELEDLFGEVPENIFIESPEIFDDAKKELGLTDKQTKEELQVYGIKVEREVARVY